MLRRIYALSFLPPFFAQWAFPHFFFSSGGFHFPPFLPPRISPIKKNDDDTYGKQDWTLIRDLRLFMKGKRNNQARRGGGATVFGILFQKVLKFDKRRRRTLLCIPWPVRVVGGGEQLIHPPPPLDFPFPPKNEKGKVPFLFPFFWASVRARDFLFPSPPTPH